MITGGRVNSDSHVHNLQKYQKITGRINGEIKQVHTKDRVAPAPETVVVLSGRGLDEFDS